MRPGHEPAQSGTAAPGTTVAVVEDDPAVRASVVFSLEREGYRVLEWADGLSAWEGLTLDTNSSSTALSADVVILDVMMPRMDGLELCRRIRGRSESVPILFLTSRDEEFDRVLGLELGADDYLCKPFSMRELLARVKVMLRRLQLIHSASTSSPAERELIASGSLSLDLDRYEAQWKGQLVRLTITEFQLLLAMARRPGHVKSRAQLMTEGYPHDNYVSERTIDTHIKRLRRKFQDIDGEFDELETVYGVGYRWRVPSQLALSDSSLAPC